MSTKRFGTSVLHSPGEVSLHCLRALYFLGVALLVCGCTQEKANREAARPATAPELKRDERAHTFAGVEFAHIGGGTIHLGSLSSEPMRDATSEQRVEVRVDSFYLSITEVTEKQYNEVVASPSSYTVSSSSLPMTGVTWKEAVRFCQLLSVKGRGEYRLPTEVEWEYASRAGSDEMFSVWSGSSPLTDAVRSFHRGDDGKLYRGARASFNFGTHRLAEVGHYRSNAFGLFDMHGNAWEWVTVDSRRGESIGPVYAPIRGGSAMSPSPFSCRSANRSWEPVDSRKPSIGFRVVYVE